MDRLLRDTPKKRLDAYKRGAVLRDGPVRIVRWACLFNVVFYPYPHPRNSTTPYATEESLYDQSLYSRALAVSVCSICFQIFVEIMYSIAGSTS